MLVYPVPTILLGLALTPTGRAVGLDAGPAEGSENAAVTAASAGSTAGDVSAIGRQLRLYAERAKATRLTVVAGSVVTGATLLSTGIVLEGRSDDVSKSIGVGMIAGGAAPLLFSALLLGPSGIERLSASFDARAGDGTGDPDVLRGTDESWQQAASASRHKRLVAGTVETAMGGALSAAGVYLLLAKNGIWGMSRNGQYEVGSFLVGPGIPILSLGIRSLFVESLEETSWKLHNATREPLQRRTAAVTIGVAPTHGGVVTSLAASLW